MGRAPRRGWGQASKGERTEGGPRRGALSRAGAHQLPARLKRVAASGPTKDETSGQQGAMKEGVRLTVLMRALTLRCHLLCAHHKPSLSGEHLGEGSRRPKGSGVGLGWGVRQVGRRSEAGPHKWQPDSPALEDRTQREWRNTWNILVQGALLQGADIFQPWS